MADIIDPSEIMFTPFEPKVKNRFIMYIEGIPASVMEWVRLHKESVTGRDGYSDFYKKDVTFNVLGPVGDKVEEWTLKGAMIQSANFGDMNFEANEPNDITLTLRYDYAILQF